MPNNGIRGCLWLLLWFWGPYFSYAFALPRLDKGRGAYSYWNLICMFCWYSWDTNPFLNRNGRVDWGVGTTEGHGRDWKDRREGNLRPGCKRNKYIYRKNKNKRKVGPHTGIKSCHISHTLHTHMYMHIQIQTYAGTHTHLPDREKLFVIAIWHPASRGSVCDFCVCCPWCSTRPVPSNGRNRSSDFFRESVFPPVASTRRI